jgi:hypothetical protein
VRRDQRRRRLLIGLVALVALAATGLVGYRVVRPGELIDPAKSAYPSSAPVAQPRVYGTLLATPIVVDGRLRVYAGKRQVYADAPVDMKSSVSRFWSFRRWPAQVVGVAAVNATVVSLWSDGALVGLDATRGTVAWRADVRQTAEITFNGRRTGAATVHAPQNLLTAGSTVIAVGIPGTTAFDAATGRQLWHRTPNRCQNDFTTPDTFVSLDTCGTAPHATVLDARTGAPRDWPQAAFTPIGCATGRSGCRGVVAGQEGWTVGAGGTLAPAPALAAPGTWLVDGVAVRSAADGTVEGRDANHDRPLWTSNAGTVVAVEPGAVHLMTTGHREVVTLDPADGHVLSRYPFVVPDSGPFDLGRVFAADRFLFVERARPGATADRSDSAYFYPSPNVVIAGS